MTSKQIRLSLEYHLHLYSDDAVEAMFIDQRLAKNLCKCPCYQS